VRDRIKIIVNPFSGGGKARRLAESVAGELRRTGCAVEVHETRQTGAQGGGFSVVGCAGGDGTINEVVNGLPEGDATPLALLPSGTANVLAKELHLPRDPGRLARIIHEGREIRWDLGVDHTHGRKFLLFAGAGYDAHVVHLFHSARRKPAYVWNSALWNMGLYVVWGMKSILAYSAPRIAVELDGKPITAEATWVQISNVRSYGGPLAFTPRARPDDGLFDVMVQRAGQRRDVVRMFWAGLLNYFLPVDIRTPDVAFYRAREVRLATADGRSVPLQVDGDPAGQLPAHFQVLPGALRILAP
jgi:YegS/Rv2252/BmrU family lipid kinase